MLSPLLLRVQVGGEEPRALESIPCIYTLREKESGKYSRKSQEK